MTTPFLRAARGAPWVSLDRLSGGGNVLVLAPHPDDQTLGCGAAIAALSDLGRRAQVVVVTDGARSHPASRGTPSPRLRAQRAAEATHAVGILTSGLGPAPVFLDYPDTDAPNGDGPLDVAIALIRPHITPATRAVWSAWGGDPHIDHARTARLAARLVARTGSTSLWSYPIWGRFAPEIPDCGTPGLVRFETGRWQTCKAAAIAAHASQMAGLISDDPGGFRMTDAHQRHFLQSPEFFLPEVA